MKVIFNFNAIEATVVPSIDEALHGLSEAIRLSSGLNPPTNLSHANFLRTLGSELRQCERTLNNIKTSFNNTNGRLRNASANNNAQFSRIRDIHIPKRTGVVNNI